MGKLATHPLVSIRPPAYSTGGLTSNCMTPMMKKVLLRKEDFLHSPAGVSHHQAPFQGAGEFKVFRLLLGVERSAWR